MFQNLWNKFQSYFDNNISKKRSISQSTANNIVEETPAKKFKIDHQIEDLLNMNEDVTRPLKDTFAYTTRNVTTRKDLEKVKSNGYLFHDTIKKPDYTCTFKKDIISDNYNFKGSPNFRYKSTPKSSINSKLFVAKEKVEVKKNNKENLTTNECIRLKEKKEYEALVNKYSGQNFISSTIINLAHNIKKAGVIENPSHIICVDSEDSNLSLRGDSEIPDISINRIDREKMLSLNNSNPLKDKKFMASSDGIEIDSKSSKVDKFIRDRLKQPYRSNFDRTMTYIDDVSITDSNTSSRGLVTEGYSIGRAWRSNNWERRLEKTSRVLNEVFVNAKSSFNFENIHRHKSFVDEVIIIDPSTDDDSNVENKTEIIDLENQNIRSKEIEDFSAAMAKSPFSNQQYVTDMRRSVTNTDVKESIVKGEAEINFYKNLRQKDEAKIINKMNKILQISKRITPPIDESILFVDDSDEDDSVQLIEGVKEKEDEEFIDLTAEQEQKVADVFRQGMSEKVVAEAFRLQITYKDLSTLASLNWLNDEIINFYMNLIVARDSTHIYTFNTFFYPKIASEGQKSVRRWTKNIDIFSFKIILVPIHLGVHWCLAVVDFENKQIRYYDSMGGNNQHCLQSLQAYLQDEHKDKKGSDYNLKDWQKIIVKDIPQQMNGSDCGMFACKFAEYISRGATINFNQNHMPYFRKRMVLEILEKRLWSS